MNSSQLDYLKRRLVDLLATLYLPDKALPESLEWALKTRSLDKMRDYFSQRVDPVEMPSDEQQGLSGTCYVCSDQTRFIYSDTERPINWREMLNCEQCGLINRWRSGFHLFEQICSLRSEDEIYITEAITPLYRLLKKHYPNTIGSEFNSGFAPGATFSHHGQDMQMQDVTQLTFPNKTFSAVLSFDVLEHVPDYKSALDEFYRVLRPGGWMLISVPFTFRQETEIRAQVAEDGEIKHFLPAQYHGDPMAQAGVLCFQVFGMDFLQEISAVGFRHAWLCAFHSEVYGYRDHNILFVARK